MISSQDLNKDKVLGMLWGAVVGDVLGSPHEFRLSTPVSEYTGVVEYTTQVFSRYHPTRKTVVGQVTDDSEMTITLLTSLVINKGYDKNKTILAYLEWANSKTPFLGTNTRSLLYGVKTIKGYQKRYNTVYFLTDPSEYTQSNGCLMRCSPLALVLNVEQTVETDCKITNQSPTCIDACVTYVRALQDLLMNQRVEEVTSRAIVMTKMDNVRATIDDAVNGHTVRQVDGKNKGWVLHALWCAFRSLIRVKQSSYEDTISWVISLGGDTDTNACISGAMIGAYLGRDRMLFEPNMLHNITVIKSCATEDGDIHRPQEYHPRNIDSLVETLFHLEDF